MLPLLVKVATDTGRGFYQGAEHVFLLSLATYFLFSCLTRGNSLKLVTNHFRLDVFMFFFANHVFDIWNSLPHAEVGAGPR